QAIWELKQKADEAPHDHNLRRELLKLFFESREYMERSAGIPESDRSFLLLQERESICCLLIHGAGGTPSEMKELGEHLYSQGYTVYGTRLPLDTRNDQPGITSYLKGRFAGKRNGTGKARRSSSWSECLTQSEILLEMISGYSESTYIIGFSFGGTIAIELALRQKVRGTILIAPAIFPSRSGRYLVFRFWKKIFPGLMKEVSPAKSTMLEFIDRTRSNLSRLPEPLLVVQAADDPVVGQRGFQLLKRLSSDKDSRFIMLKDGGHVIVQGDRCVEVMDICSSFIRGT
ncbi:MAG TPA: alpha/beta fold hydrolase, partial [Candidatus Krumholzibacterium sp.]|nr:alpha/beta fold hydrolase [Candidatus Krumholzibacterium sp.]